METKNQNRNNTLIKSMFSFLITKQINCNLIDLDPSNEPDSIQNLIIQGSHLDRNSNTFLFQIFLQPDRLKKETAQPQVTILFQHLIDQSIQIDVDTNGQLYSTITQYLYTKILIPFNKHKTKKEKSIS